MNSSPAAGIAPTALFVVLWSSGALFAKWGLAHASPFVFLVLRFALALAVLAAFAALHGGGWPRAGTRLQVATTGLLLVGGYSAFYFLALAGGITPGVLATLLGVQPLLTLALTERPLSRLRIGGLLLALAGLAMVVAESLLATSVTPSGLGCALLCLGAMTWGTLLQKRIDQAPAAVLPLQYAVALLLCAALLPWVELRVQWTVGLAVTVAWMGVVITGATLLLYRLIQAGNLVNVTSLFYLVPVGTALLDGLVLGNIPAPLTVAGMATILGGLALVFKTSG